MSFKEGEAGTKKLSELVQGSAWTFVLTAQADACARLGVVHSYFNYGSRISTHQIFWSFS